MISKSSVHKPILLFALTCCLLGVLLGAFGAHGLKNVLDVKALETFETAVRYQMYHGISLLVISLAANGFTAKSWKVGMYLLATGICLFSGSLFFFVASGIRIFAFITPFGGLCLLAGWAALIFSAARHQFVDSKP